MRILSCISLKWRLIWSGLLCAILTGLSGGAGILSLRQIHGNMEDTTQEIQANITAQNDQVRQLIVLRSLVASIAGASGDEALKDQTCALETLGKSWPAPESEHENSILATVSELVVEKGDQLQALDELDRLRKQNNMALEKIISQAMYIGDNIEFEATLQIDDALSMENTDFAKIAPLLLDLLQQVKAALKVRANCNQLHSLVQDTLSRNDLAVVNYRWTEVQTLLGNTRSELTGLAMDENAGEIMDLLHTIEGLTDLMFQAQKELIQAEDALADSSARINVEMARMDAATLDIAWEVKWNAEKAMLMSSGSVHQWQNLEIMLVVVAFVLAMGVGFVISRSVSTQLNTLNQGIRIIGEGRLEHKVDTHTKDEIGQLSRAFDGMTEKLALRETAVKESEHQFRRLFEQSNDGIIIHDLSARILDVNKRMVEMTGFKKERLLTMTLPDLHMDEDSDLVWEKLDEISSQKGIQRESVYMRADGGLIQVDIRATLIDPKEGTIQTVIRDITQRKQAEAELKAHMEEMTEANRRLEILVSNTTDREKQMVVLKKEVNELLTAMGQKSKYEAPARVAELVVGSGTREEKDD